jgi:hypothetical protein
MSTAEGRVDAFKALMPALQKVSDKLERVVVTEDLAAYLRVDRSVILDQFKRADVARAVPTARPSQQSTIPSLEWLLLTALLGSERARTEVLPMLTREMTDGFATREILDALQQSNGTTGGFSALESRLSAPQQALLHELLAADDIGDEDSGWEQAQSCLRRLEEGVRRRRMDDLRSRIKAEEREGRLEEALRMAAELHQLEKEIKRGAVR